MLARFFIDRPIFAWVIAILIMVAGGISITKLPISRYPNIAPPSVNVNSVYPGASAKVVLSFDAPSNSRRLKSSDFFQVYSPSA